MSIKKNVSIIVNNYNYCRFLARALDSALEQTYPDTEIIVVDDGSTDNSHQVIKAYGDRITSVYKTNEGQASAFNAGFTVSSGDIVFFLDADDYLLPTAVEEVVAMWHEDTAKAHFLLEGIDVAGQPLGYTYPARGEYLGRGNVVPKLLERGVYGVAPTTGNAFARWALESLLPIDEEAYRISADGYLATAIAFCGPIIAIEKTLGAYRVHGSNNWGTNLEGKKFRAFIEHDLRKQALLTEQATAHGYEVPSDLLLRTNTHLWARVASLRLDPSHHPLPEDSVLKLIYYGIYSAWVYSDLTRQKRLVVATWFLVVGLMPLAIAKPAISWLFAQESRPKLVTRVLQKLRPLLNRA